MCVSARACVCVCVCVCVCEGVNYCAHLCFIITLDTVLLSNKVDHQSKRAAAYELRYEYHSALFSIHFLYILQHLVILLQFCNLIFLLNVTIQAKFIRSFISCCYY